MSSADLPVEMPLAAWSSLPRNGSHRVIAPALASVVLLLFLVPITGSAGAVTQSGGAPTDTPNLSLVPSPAIGNAPLSGNLTASISGGVGPYSLSVCFGTVDHSSATPNCAPNVSGWSGASPFLFPYSYSTPGNFSVIGIATDSHGAGVGTTVLIVVTSGSRLEVNPVENTTNGTAPLTVHLEASVLGGTPPLSIQWDFGDGSSGSSLPGVPVNHTYSMAGVFTPILTVVDAAGHRVTRTLSPIVVASSLNGGATAADLTSTVEAIGLFAAVAGGAAVLARVWQVRRWREEGNELVDGMIHPAEDPNPPHT